MHVTPETTRTWRFHAAADLGETEKALERAARVRDGVAQTLRTACAEHLRITVLTRYAVPPCAPGRATLAPGLEAMVLHHERIEERLIEHAHYWQVRNTDATRDAAEIQTIEEVMGTGAYRGERCSNDAVHSSCAEGIGIHAKGDQSIAAIYAALCESTVPMQIVQHVSREHQGWARERVARHTLWVQGTGDLLHAVIARVADRAGATVATPPRRSRSLGPAEARAMTVVASGPPGTRASPWASAPLAAFRADLNQAFGFSWHLSADPASPGHTLVVGPRGSGKTTLVARLAALTLARTHAQVWMLARAGDARWFAHRAGVDVHAPPRVSDDRIGVADLAHFNDAGRLTQFANQVHARALGTGVPALVWIDDIEPFTGNLARALRIAILEGRKCDVAYVLCARAIEGFALDVARVLTVQQIVLPGACDAALALGARARQSMRDAAAGNRREALIVRSDCTARVHVGDHRTASIIPGA